MLNPVPLPYRILFVIGVLFAGIGIGWHFRGTEEASASLVVQKQEVTRGNAVNAADHQAAVAHESKRQAQAAVDRQVAQQAATSAAKPEYQTCQLAPEDLAALNQAITGGDHVLH